MSFVAGFGKINIDLLFQGFDRLAGVGEELYCKNFSLQLGGGVPATLINLSRLGVNVRIATMLGEDMFSRFAKGELEKNNADFTNLHSGNSLPVNITSAIILENDRTFYSYSDNCHCIGFENEEKFYNMAKGAKICIIQPDGFIDAYKRLKEDGTVLVLDTGWSDDLSLEKYGDLIELADYYTPNRKEAVKITGESTPEKAAYALKKYFDRVIVKLDSDGCIGIENGKEFIVSSIKGINAVDSTGAGDAFLSGLIYGLFYDYSFKECIEFGNLTGGKCVTGIGALTAFLTEEELISSRRKFFGGDRSDR